MNQVNTTAKVRHLLLAFLTGRKQHGSSSPAHPERVEGVERDSLHSYGSTSSPRAEQCGRVARALGWLAAAVFVLAIPTFLVTSNVRWAFNSLSLYRYGFQEYGAVRTTGLDMGQLMEVAREIRDSFSSSQELLDVWVVLDGQERALFNQGETLHMRDVKGLVRGVYRTQETAGAYIVAYLLAALLLSRGRGAHALAGHVIGGSLLAVGLVLVVGLTSLVGFDRLFDQFHVLSFNRGTWSFDPAYNYLTRLFTEGFFLRATLLIALGVIVEALLLAAAAWVIRGWLLGRLGRSEASTHLRKRAL